jgi:hypothetical protein
VKGWGVEATVGFDGATILAEFNDIFRHAGLPFFGDRGLFALARSRTNRKASNYSTESSYFRPLPAARQRPTLRCLRCHPIAFML